jgi:hypothetical protein
VDVLEAVVEVSFRTVAQVGRVDEVRLFDVEVIEETLVEDGLGPHLVELLPRKMLPDPHATD